jgi:hypothetical protein
MQQPPQQQLVAHRYGADAQYTAHAGQMAQAGWRVVSVMREPTGAIVATYAQAGAPATLPAPHASLAENRHPLKIPAIITGAALVAFLLCVGLALLTNALSATSHGAPSATSAAPTLPPAPTDTPAPLGVTGARLGGPIVDFDARYGGDNPPGPIYQWNTMLAGAPVQLTVSLSLNNDAVDGQNRAIIIDITTPNGSGTPWSAAEDAAIVSSFLPIDARHTKDVKDVAGSGALGPDHIYISQQLAASLSPSLFSSIATGRQLTPGTFDWQCSTQHPSCEVGVGTNS